MIAQMICAFDYTLDFVQKSVADLTEDQMVQQTPGTPNHGTWILGHLAFSCQGLASELGGQPWLPNDWESKFGYGSTPASDVSIYPGKAEMQKLLTDAASRLRQLLQAISENDLAQGIPDETFPTKGHLLMQVVVGHTAYHAGQLAVWRRAIGKPSAGVFI